MWYCSSPVFGLGCVRRPDVPGCNPSGGLGGCSISQPCTDSWLRVPPSGEANVERTESRGSGRADISPSMIFVDESIVAVGKRRRMDILLDFLTIAKATTKSGSFRKF
jgi:hypothetical protein